MARIEGERVPERGAGLVADQHDVVVAAALFTGLTDSINAGYVDTGLSIRTVEDTFARAYAALDRYDPNQSFTTWIFVIGRRLAANEKRRRARQRARESELAREEDSEQTNPDLDQGTVWLAAQKILPKTSYATIWLHYGEGQSVKEIARILGKSVTGVKVTLYRARRTLARKLDPKLVAESIER